MDSAILTMEEINHLFPNEWILLGLENNSVKNDTGTVLFQSKDYLELCYKGSEIAQNTLTKIFYTGEQNHNRKWLKAIPSVFTPKSRIFV